jgi:hypothetical protein
MPVPITLLVDDCSPVNPMFFHDPPYPHPLLIPNAFVRDFARLCARHGVRGKFSVLPMPCCLGGIDGRLNHVPPRQLAGFLRIVREQIAPRFDITPELLTHHAAYRLEGGFHHLFEDEWVARATVEEMADYLAVALEILEHVGLPASGVTSPWSTGIGNEVPYARAIGAAQWRVHRREVTWYFLHVAADGPPPAPSVTWRDPATGQAVVSIPATTTDPFWNTQRPMSGSARAARAAAQAGVDALLPATGDAGRIPEVIRAGRPVALLTHWQSLYSDGTTAGLHGLAALLERLRARYGADLKWMTCSEVAANTADGQTWTPAAGG